MSELARIVSFMHADPETLPGVPSNPEIIQQIIDANKPLKVEMDDLTEGERRGFLQMWQTGFVRDAIMTRDSDSLNEVYSDSAWELENPDITARRLQDLRFINPIARNEIAYREVKEQSR